MEKTNKLSEITDEIAVRIHNGEPGLMHDLWNAVERYVSWIANKYAKAYVAGGLVHSEKEAYDDIYNGCGYPAMCDAVKHFDPERGSFITLFTYWMRKEMRAFYGVRSRLPDAALRAQSLNVLVGDEDERELMDMIEDPSDYYEMIENRILRNEARNLIDAALREIDKDEAFVVRSRYLDGVPMSRLHETLDCSRAYVQSLERKAFASIRKGRYRDKLFEILHPGIESYFGYRGTSFHAYQNTGERATERAALDVIRIKDNYRGK